MGVRVFSMALCLAATACGGGAVECPALPCPQTGLTITLTNPPSGPYRVEALAPGDSAPHAQDCSGSGPCFIHFTNYEPAEVRITVISASGSTTFDATPFYSTSFPFGPECGGCRSGSVTVP